jgi:hypothetical protein
MLGAISSLLEKLHKATHVPNWGGTNMQLEWDSSSDEEVDIKDQEVSFI